MAAAAEQPKKPAGGAFGRFMAEKRAEFMKQCAGQPISAVTKLGSAEWKKVSETARAPYQKLFEEAQKKYTADMEAFIASGGVKQKGAAALRAEKRKAKEVKASAKDPNAPKRPAGGAYGCYVAANRAELQKECPGSVTGVSKLASERWKSLSAAEKVKYEKEYAAKAAAYEEAKKNYVPPARPAADDEEAAAPPAKKAKGSASGKKAVSDGDVNAQPAAAAAKRAAGAGKANAKSKAKARVAPKAASVDPLDIPQGVLAKAEKSNMVEALQKLLVRGDIKNAGVAAGKALDALVESNGLLHPARRALLGA